MSQDIDDLLALFDQGLAEQEAFCGINPDDLACQARSILEEARSQLDKAIASGKGEVQVMRLEYMKDYTGNLELTGVAQVVFHRLSLMGHAPYIRRAQSSATMTFDIVIPTYA